MQELLEMSALLELPLKFKITPINADMDGNWKVDMSGFDITYFLKFCHNGHQLQTL